MPKTDKKYRVVIDTNLIVSAVISKGNQPDMLLSAWQKNLFHLVISNELLDEIKDVLFRRHIKEKYHLTEDLIAKLISALRFACEYIVFSQEYDLPIHCRDPKDDGLLALAFHTQADFLISGDNDLLILNGNPALGKLKIVKVKDFLEILRIREKFLVM